MSDQWNVIDMAILREQFPSLIIGEDWFTEEELKAMDIEESERIICETCGCKANEIHDDSMCNPGSQE